MGPIDIVLIVAGVGFVLARRTVGELLEIKGLLVVPVVLTVIGALQLRRIAHVDVATVAFVAVGVALSVGLGVLRGRTVHLGERNGELWMRYRASTIALWVLNLALKGLAVPIEHAVSPSAASAANHTILFSIGVGILAETAVVLWRALGTRATVVWEKGENGAAHRTSPAFEQARAWRADDGAVDLRKRVRLPQRNW